MFRISQYMRELAHAEQTGHYPCQSASNSFQVSASKFFQLLRLI